MEFFTEKEEDFVGMRHFQLSSELLCRLKILYEKSYSDKKEEFKEKCFGLIISNEKYK
jgi:hypothetical protein